MNTGNICILSEPIQTGKTSVLMNWVRHTPNVGGILTPDVNGSRQLYCIRTQTYHPLQLPATAQGIHIGRFIFDTDTFAHARQTLLEDVLLPLDWVIADEIGRLETQRNEGLEPAITKVIQHFQQHHTSGKLLLIIRDYLLNETIAHYQLNNPIILKKDFFLNSCTSLAPLIGVVLCGGKSSRMGTDKAFIRYHTQPQVYHTACLLQQACDDVLISCNTEQAALLESGYRHVTDQPGYIDAGPMSGILSSWSTCSDQAILVAGCDYPYLTSADVHHLIESREPGYQAVCFRNAEGFAEPLLAVYEPDAYPKLLQYFASGQNSLRHFLGTLQVKFLTPASYHTLTSIDSPEMFSLWPKQP
jgi:molybdopterin-guanine dinucleotide biosynthesis protein A/nucleoside-triphosphatase THEP1